MRNRPWHIVLSIAFSAATIFGSDKDYSSRGPEYSILRGIHLDVSKIKFLEERNVALYGATPKASVFTITSNVVIQTVESVVSTGSVWEDLDVDYELIVGNDVDSHLHKYLIDDLHNCLRQDEKRSQWECETHLVAGKTSNLLVHAQRYSFPEVIWFNGRFVQLNFLAFRDKKKSGFGAEQSFWEEKIKFYDEKKRIKFDGEKYVDRSEFLRLYKSGSLEKRR